jgi:hypothetical protein
MTKIGMVFYPFNSNKKLLCQVLCQHLFIKLVINTKYNIYLLLFNKLFLNIFIVPWEKKRRKKDIVQVLRMAVRIVRAYLEDVLKKLKRGNIKIKVKNLKRISSRVKKR